MNYSFSFPPGSVAMCSTLEIPKGWVICDGSSLDGNLYQYEDLWLAIGTTYGGSGKSSFRVPSLGGRTVVGVKSSTAGSGIDGPVGSWGGCSSTTLTAAQTGVKSHIHTVTDPGHSHSLSSGFSSHTHNVKYNVSPGLNRTGANRNLFYASSGNEYTYGDTGGITNVSIGSISMNDNSVGSITINQSSSSNASASHTNMQPSIVFNYIIKL